MINISYNEETDYLEINNNKIIKEYSNFFNFRYKFYYRIKINEYYCGIDYAYC